MSIEVRILCADEAGVLTNVADDVFDHDVRPELAAEYLADPRFHLAVALDGEQVVGMASAIDYVHPDKPSQWFINEVGVAPSHQRRGLGRRLLAALLAHARARGGVEAWVATEVDNSAARALYADSGGIEDPQRAVVYTFRLE
ncbi:MAG: GNAT family N-acetyltransferase [Pirellulales bacterium]